MHILRSLLLSLLVAIAAALPARAADDAELTRLVDALGAGGFDDTSAQIAALAATGVGHFASVHEAAQAWYRPGRQIRPDPERSATYEEIYDRYLDLARRVYGRERGGERAT